MQSGGHPTSKYSTFTSIGCESDKRFYYATFDDHGYNRVLSFTTRCPESRASTVEKTNKRSFALVSPLSRQDAGRSLLHQALVASLRNNSFSRPTYQDDAPGSQLSTSSPGVCKNDVDCFTRTHTADSLWCSAASHA